MLFKHYLAEKGTLPQREALKAAAVTASTGLHRRSQIHQAINAALARLARQYGFNADKQYATPRGRVDLVWLQGGKPVPVLAAETDYWVKRKSIRKLLALNCQRVLASYSDLPREIPEGIEHITLSLYRLESRKRRLPSELPSGDQPEALV